MIRFNSSNEWRAAIAALALVIALPLAARAQTPAPAATPAAPADSAVKSAAPAATPSTTAQPAAPVATPSATAHAAAPPAKTSMTAAMPDSVRAAVRAQAEKELKAMADSLKLTSAQREKIRPIIVAHGYQLLQLREKYATQPRTPETREAMMKDLQSLRDATDAKLAGAMSAEQMTRYKQMRDEMMARAKARMAAADSSAGANK